MRITVVLVWLLSLCLLGYWVEQDQAVLIIGAYTLSFAGYFFLVKLPRFSLRQLIIAGLIARLVLFVSFPTLSDDIYRFVWDGHLVNQGINPYTHKPADLVDRLNKEELFLVLNSPDYYSVYPSICQVTFAMASWLSNGDLFWSAVIIRVFLLIADIGLLWLILRWLASLGFPGSRAMWLFLNPLFIVETHVNLHYEVMMAFFLVLALTRLNRPIRSALSYSAAVATKLLPLIFLPLLIFSRSSSARKPIWLSAMILALLILFYPILSTLMESGFFNSINLYFQTFEFNAGIYYVVRWLGYQYWGYNGIAIIGPMLAFASLSVILYITYRYRQANQALWPEAMTIMLIVYLLGATTVHPWYLILPMVVGIASRLVTPFVWSFAVVLSYHAYAEDVTREIPWVIALEYILVGAAIVRDIRRIIKEPDRNNPAWLSDSRTIKY